MGRGISPKGVIAPRSLIGGFMSDAMVGNAPLRALTRKSATAEHARPSAKWTKVQLPGLQPGAKFYRLYGACMEGRGYTVK